MTVRFALYMQDKHDMRYELEMARYAEERGFTEIWQADTRLARDCVVMMSAFLTYTKRLRIGSGVLPIWTRNAAVIAASWGSDLIQLRSCLKARDRLRWERSATLPRASHQISCREVSTRAW